MANGVHRCGRRPHRQPSKGFGSVSRGQKDPTARRLLLAHVASHIHKPREGRVGHEVRLQRRVHAQRRAVGTPDGVVADQPVAFGLGNCSKPRWRAKDWLVHIRWMLEPALLEIPLDQFIDGFSLGPWRTSRAVGTRRPHALQVRAGCTDERRSKRLAPAPALRPPQKAQHSDGAEREPPPRPDHATMGVAARQVCM